MSSVHARLNKLEQRFVPPSLPVARAAILPELRALFDELSPILEQSEAIRKVMEEAKVHGFTRQNRTTFWVTLGKLLLPHPALHQRMCDLMRKQIEANEAAAAKQAGAEQTCGP